MPTVPQLNDVLQALKSLKTYLHQQWGITELAVFGSVARGEATAESDIDILFDYERPIGWDIVIMGDYLEEQLQHKVDLLSKKAVRPKIWALIQQDMRYV